MCGEGNCDLIDLTKWIAWGACALSIVGIYTIRSLLGSGSIVCVAATIAVLKLSIGVACLVVVLNNSRGCLFPDGPYSDMYYMWPVILLTLSVMWVVRACMYWRMRTVLPLASQGQTGFQQPGQQLSSIAQIQAVEVRSAAADGIRQV